jgi:hypothetical protein
VKAGVGVDGGVEDRIDIGVGVNVGGGEIFSVSGLRAEICTGGGLCKLGCYNWGVHIGFSSWEVQVCAFKLGVQVGACHVSKSWHPLAEFHNSTDLDPLL